MTVGTETPSTMTEAIHPDAAALSMQALTQARCGSVGKYCSPSLTDIGRSEPGQHMLIVGVSGGVGGEDGNRFTGGVGRQLRAMMLSRFVSQRLTAIISKEHYSFIG